MLERYRYTIAAAGLALLLLPRVPGIGQQVNGAYLGVGIGPFAFQPAEFGKIAIVIFLAAYLRDTRQLLVQGARRFAGVTIPPLKHFGPLLVVWGAAMFLLFFIQDLGSSLMYFGGFLALLYVATNRFSFVVVGLVLFVVGAYAHVPDPRPHPGPRRRSGSTRSSPALVEKEGYQIAQSPVRAGRRRAVRHRLRPGAAVGRAARRCCRPPHTDLIYAVIVNELGLAGACGLLLVYLLFAERGFKIAMLAPDSFSKLLAAGLTAVFALQVFVIVGGVTQGDPADRRDAAVRLLRRLVDRGQLRAAGAAAARLRPRAEAGAPAMNAADRPPLRASSRCCSACSCSPPRGGACSRAEDLRDNAANRRPLLAEERIKRGTIRAADGKVLARCAKVDKERYRAPLPDRRAVRPRGRLLVHRARPLRPRAVPQRPADGPPDRADRRGRLAARRARGRRRSARRSTRRRSRRRSTA